MEEKELTAELAAVKTKKEDAIGKRSKWRGGDGSEMREGHNKRKREEEFTKQCHLQLRLLQLYGRC